MADRTESGGAAAGGHVPEDLDAGWDVDSGWDEPAEQAPSAALASQDGSELDGSDRARAAELGLEPLASDARPAPLEIADPPARVFEVFEPPSASMVAAAASGHERASSLSPPSLKPTALSVAPSGALESSRAAAAPAPSPRARGARFRALYWAAAAIVVLGAGGVALRQARSRGVADARGAARIEAAVTAQAASEPSPSPAVPPAEQPPAAAAASEPAVPAALPSVEAPAAQPEPSAAPSAAAPNAPMRVIVRATPKGAILLERGKRLGTNQIEVEVQPGKPRTLVSLIDGYLPTKFKVDGSEPEVMIHLRRAPDAAQKP